MSAKEVIKAAPTGPTRQFEVRNNFNDLVGKWEETYVNFSGYFGKHGPHVFAAATELLEALELALFVRGTSDDTSEVRTKMEQAIKKAKGETNE